MSGMPAGHLRTCGRAAAFWSLRLWRDPARPPVRVGDNPKWRAQRGDNLKVISSVKSKRGPGDGERAGSRRSAPPGNTVQPVPPKYFDKTATRKARGNTSRKSQRKQAPSSRQPCSLEIECGSVEVWECGRQYLLPYLHTSTLPHSAYGEAGGITGSIRILRISLRHCAGERTKPPR